METPLLVKFIINRNVDKLSSKPLNEGMIPWVIWVTGNDSKSRFESTLIIGDCWLQENSLKNLQVANWAFKWNDRYFPQQTQFYVNFVQANGVHIVTILAKNSNGWDYSSEQDP